MWRGCRRWYRYGADNGTGASVIPHIEQDGNVSIVFYPRYAAKVKAALATPLGPSPRRVRLLRGTFPSTGPGDQHKFDIQPGASDTGSMTLRLPRLPIGLDPLIKEAKRRVRRRRLFLSLALAAVIAASLALTLRPGEPPNPSPGGTASAVLPKNPLVVLDYSIGPVRLGESRESVEKALGPGHVIRGYRGDVSYFGGRLTVNYYFQETLTSSVRAIQTSWPGFHTRSGFRVGASRQAAASIPRMQCGDGECGRYLLPRHADGPLTQIYLRHGRVTEIDIAYG
jgi:hypothetical protein